MSLILLVVHCLIEQSSCVPTPHLNEPDATQDSQGNHSHWVNSPSTRGTWSLLLSSFTTLFLCAWTAYHPNVPPPGANLAGRRAQWVLTALLAPEFILYRAWRQYSGAQRLRTEINKLGESRAVGKDLHQLFPPRRECPHDDDDERKSRIDRDDSATVRHTLTWPLSMNVTPNLENLTHAHKKGHFIPWKLEQAFFAVAGGLCVESSSFYPLDRLTFTPIGVLVLAKAGLLPIVEPTIVKDKSKADGLGKCIVCIQAAWFLVQCLARLAQRLPLTLLEVHTLAHIFCAFAMYAIWFKKPYDVHSPIVLEDEDITDLAAFFALQPYMPPVMEDTMKMRYGCAQTDTPRTTLFRTAHEHPIRPDMSWRIMLSSLFQSGERQIASHASKKLEIDESKVSEHVVRATRAVLRLRERGAHFPWCERKSTGSSQEWLELDYWEKYVVAGAEIIRCYKIPDHQVAASARSKKLDTLSYDLFYFLALIYGSAHLAVWNSKFATTVEMWMWRGSGITLAAAPVLTSIQVWWAKGLKKLDIDPTGSQWANDESFLWKESSFSDCVRRVLWLFALRVFGISWLLLGGITGNLVLLWLPARGYVLAEAFASLRDPPPGAYNETMWASFIPHAT